LLGGADLKGISQTHICQQLKNLNFNQQPTTTIKKENLPDYKTKIDPDLCRNLSSETLSLNLNNPYHKIIQIKDNQDANIKQYLLECCQFIHQNQTGSTFVHCHSGISRSTTVCIAYIMYLDYLSGFTKFPNFTASRDYVKYVKNFRVISDPNMAFLGQLCRFYKELKQDYYNKNKKNSTSAENASHYRMVEEDCQIYDSCQNSNRQKTTCETTTCGTTLVNSQRNSSNSSNLSTSRKRSLNEMNDVSMSDRLTPTNNSSIFIQDMSENANLHPPLYDTKDRCDTNLMDSESNVKFRVGCDPALDFLSEEME